ncbi:MAG TPA: GNAT family N-acetyltransferase [Polyangiaceae bacterium]|nr:GNAT family N-acetyltransferase [Polyangiaceae bacterium]
MIELSTHESMRDVGEAEWAAVAGPDVPPFLSYAFLRALEDTGCAVPARGWQPCHLVFRKDGRAVAVAPAYVKGNSEGEFVFDQGFAQFAEGRLGIRYYPKLVVAAPFTPATGPRLLVRAGENVAELVAAFARTLPELCRRLGVSGAHVLFPDEAQARILETTGLAHRQGVQFHFKNDALGSFEDYLALFNSKRRNQIKREVRAPAEQGLELVTLSGRDLDPPLVDVVFELYVSTVEKYFWGRQYLNRSFFEEIIRKIPDAVLVVLARHSASRRPVAGAFNLLGKTALYGRYWGAREDHPFLHFNVCYYQGVRECIERRLSVFEPGAGGEHKLPRGFEPTATHSFHHFADRRLDAAARDFLGRERQAIHEHLEDYESHPVLKRTQG